MLISYCVISHGDKSADKLRLLIKSISKQEKLTESPVKSEIVLVGDGTPKDIQESVDVFVSETERTQRLGYRRNLAARHSKGDFLVFCDEDMLLYPLWENQFFAMVGALQASRESRSFVYCNKIFNPDGSRFWDYAIFEPNHRLLEYNEQADDNALLYWTGGFSVFARATFEDFPWNGDLSFYESEDVEISRRFKKAGFKPLFDRCNHIWHNDKGYFQYGQLVVRGQNFKKPSSDFTYLLEKYKE